MYILSISSFYSTNDLYWWWWWWWWWWCHRKPVCRLSLVCDVHAAYSVR